MFLHGCEVRPGEGGVGEGLGFVNYNRGQSITVPFDASRASDLTVLEFDGETFRRADGSRTATVVADAGSAGVRGAVRSASLH